MPIQVVDHPLAGQLLAELRDKSTPPDRFRDLTWNLTTILVLEATRSMAVQVTRVDTPLEPAEARILAESLAIVPVLRAGLGMVEPAVKLFPDVAVGYIGLERHEDTAIARSYYSKLPNLSGKFTLCLDPMLATGGSASQAIGLIKANGGSRIVMVCVVAAPEGLDKLEADHPDIMVVTASLDRGLNERKYILPGLGDFGDRLYGTF